MDCAPNIIHMQTRIADKPGALAFHRLSRNQYAYGGQSPPTLACYAPSNGGRSTINSCNGRRPDPSGGCPFRRRAQFPAGRTTSTTPCPQVPAWLWRRRHPRPGAASANTWPRCVPATRPSWRCPVAVLGWTGTAEDWLTYQAHGCMEQVA